MKFAILGASRGLGAALVQLLQAELGLSAKLLLSSRKENFLRERVRVDHDQFIAADFTQIAGQMKLQAALRDFVPDRVFYVAGGGPYGRFEEKQMKDHMWALELNLIYPMKLLHFLMSTPAIRQTLQQVVIVGSGIAGEKPDPLASSYAAAKHGLRGLVSTVQAEKSGLDVRLYEPGYIDTSLLPQNAWPRQQQAKTGEKLIATASEEASKLWQWSQF